MAKNELSTMLTTIMFSRTAFDSVEKAKAVISYLFQDSRFVPDRVGVAEPFKRITEDGIRSAIVALADELGQAREPDRVSAHITFERAVDPYCRFCLEWARLSHRAFSKCASYISQYEIQDSAELKRWLSFNEGFIGFVAPWYSMICLDDEISHKNRAKWRVCRRYARDPNWGVTTIGTMAWNPHQHGIPGVYWGNYFNAFYVDWFGREKFDGLPCVEKR